MTPPILNFDRSRFSDALRREAEPVLDTTLEGDGFIRAYTKASKTIKAKAFRGGMLPIVGLAQGTLERLASMVRLRAKIGLDVGRQNTLYLTVVSRLDEPQGLCPRDAWHARVAWRRSPNRSVPILSRGPCCRGAPKLG
eukprot:2387152-Amphidinium_carterae.1